MLKRLLVIAALGEAVTGCALLVYPPIVIQLLFGAELAGMGVVMSRIAGMALIALGLACWPSRLTAAAFRSMVTYSALATLYLGALAIRGEWVGILLWPAVVVHAVLTCLLAGAWFTDEQIRKRA